METVYREGQKVLVHILQDLFYFKDFQGVDLEHSASKQAKIPGNIATRTNSMYEELLRSDMNAKNENDSHLRLSPEWSLCAENSYSKIQEFSVTARYVQGLFDPHGTVWRSHNKSR